MIRAMWLALAIAAVSAMAYSAALETEEDRVTWYNVEPEAICDTDTDCARFCPPPADDPECDGGPQ